MRLTPVAPQRHDPQQRLQCARCAKLQRIASVRADLDAAPFTYVCADCDPLVALDIARTAFVRAEEN